MGRCDYDNKSTVNEFGEISDLLKNFSIHSEKYFLKISEKLQCYHLTTKQILQNAFETTSLLTSEKYLDDVNELKTVAGKINDHLSDTENKFIDSSNIFISTKDLLSVIDTDVREFKKLAKYLEVQSISIKIESARIKNDNNDFDNLAVSINKLANRISNQFTGFREKSKTLNNVISNAQRQIETLRKNQKVHSAEIHTETKTSIDSLIERFELSSTKVESIHTLAKNIHNEVSSIVTAVQFNDIIRQQIEHIIQVLNDLVIKLAESNDESADFNNDELTAAVNRVSSLQSAQLKNSHDELITALDNITSGLENILANISKISGSVTELLANTGDDDSNFLSDISASLDNSIVSMNKNSVIEAELSDSSEEVIKTIEELSEFINEISNIGSEIELISLNASVKAAHTGAEGAALGVLAEAIQKLSNEAKEETSVVIDKLEAIKRLSAQLHDTNNQGNLSVENTELKSVFEQIKYITHSLEQIVNTAQVDLNRIHRQAVELETDMKKIAVNDNTQLEFENTLSRAMNILENIVINSSKGQDQNYKKQIDLNEISNKYTMQVQRDIHNSIINEKEISSNSMDVNPDLPAGEFGDNVELF